MLGSRKGLFVGLLRVHFECTRRSLGEGFCGAKLNVEPASGQRYRICFQGLLGSARYGIAIVVHFFEFGDAAIATLNPKP